MTPPPATELAANGKPVECVWDFPRPPRLETVSWRIRVVHNEQTVCDAPSAYRVLETSQPPAYYVSPEFVDAKALQPVLQSSFCEWKGMASYADVVVGDRRATDAAWHYASPTPGFAAIAGYWAFYPQALDECWVDDERVAPNPGMFYGGWITTNVTGPFKGGPGTAHW